MQVLEILENPLRQGREGVVLKVPSGVKETRRHAEKRRHVSEESNGIVHRRMGMAINNDIRNLRGATHSAPAA